MHNLRYFCHYHNGTPKEKTIKIVGSFLLIITLTLFGSSLSYAANEDIRSAYLQELMPQGEALAIAAVDIPAPVVLETTQPPGASQFENMPKEGLSPGRVLAEPPLSESFRPNPPVDQPKPVPPPPGKEERGMPSEPRPSMQPAGEGETFVSEEDEDMREKMEQERMKQEKTRVLNKEIKQQRSELTRLIKQIKRMKGAAADLEMANKLMESLATYEKAIRGAVEFDDIRAALEEYWDAQLWEDINAIRRRAQLPQELNNLFKELKRIEKTLTQKAYQKLGVDLAGIKEYIAASLQRHAESKKAYQEGDFETAEDVLQDIRENHPGECNGALNMLRGVKDQLRRVRDKAFKAEVEDLLTDPIEKLNAAECRDARETLEAIQQELGPIVWKKIMQSQNTRKGIPADVLGKIEKLKEKLGGDELESLESEEPRESLRP